ncbi:MAG: RNA polymerase sigma factor [Candidatus Niyogibacteria bacterium]|nr:RNA polymerase sigma factor [Candidatus Niyogibacteria bacterium]
MQELAANYNELVDQIFRFVYLKTSSRETAEDLTSECFMSTVKYLQTNEVQNLRAFLYKTARNKIIDHYRIKGRVIYSDEAVLANEGEIGYEDIVNRQDARMVRDTLVNLEDADKEVLTLRYTEDLSVTDIAKIVGKNPVAVRVQIFRALRKMRDILNKN